MECISNGTLEAYLDGAVDPVTRDKTEKHLEMCKECGVRFDQYKRVSADVRGLLDTLEPLPFGAGLSEAALYRAARERRPAPGIRPRLSFRSPVWACAGAAAFAGLVMTFAPVRGWAQHVLEMLRVQQIVVVPVDMSQQMNDGGRDKIAGQFLSDNVVVTMKPGEPETVSSVSEAAARAGFPVAAVDGMTPAKITVSDPFAFHMTLSRDRLQSLFEALGRPDISLPANVDGSTVAVYTPKSVRQWYGDMIFYQAPSPTVSVPKNLDLAALAEAALQVGGMSAAEAHAFASAVDWTSTLVLPAPQGQSTYTTVDVNGAKGTLIAAQEGANRQTASLVWLQHGIVHCLEGNASSVVAAANAIR